MTEDEKNVIKNHMNWPEVFLTGEHDYPDTKKGRILAIADAYMGWGCCHIKDIPLKFGDGMAAISDFLGHPVREQDLEIYCKKNGIAL